MPKIDDDNANEVVKTGSSSESAGMSKENDARDFAEADLLSNGDGEIPAEDITIYLDEFELSRLIMDSAINNFEETLNSIK